MSNVNRAVWIVRGSVGKQASLEDDTLENSWPLRLISEKRYCMMIPVPSEKMS